jgi:hypothetical protein
MFLNLSPLAAHLNESLCSLRFATKVSALLFNETQAADMVCQIGQQHTCRDRQETGQEYVNTT